MIEAMACGTPVIAFDGGSVREVIDHATTGFVVRSVPEAIHAVGWALALDRKAIRQRFEKRFTASRMAADYVSLYRELCKRKSAQVHVRLAHSRNGHGSRPYA